MEVILNENQPQIPTDEYGSGFSVRQLELSRQFYRTYPIANTLYSQLNNKVKNQLNA